MSASVASSPAKRAERTPGRAVERVDLEPGVVGDRGEPVAAAMASAFRRALPTRSGASSTTSGTSVGPRPQLDHATEDRRDLRELARVRRGRHHDRSPLIVRRRAAAAAATATISRCSSTISAMPAGGEVEHRVELRRGVNASCSAVPCTSTRRPSPLITTFMSTSARLSSS